MPLAFLKSSVKPTRRKNILRNLSNSPKRSTKFFLCRLKLPSGIARPTSRLRGMALFCLFLAALSVFAEEQDSTKEERLAELFSQAKIAQQQGDYRTAANCYQEIVKLRPEVPEAWANLGLMHQFLGEQPQANRAFEISLSKNPRLYVPNLFLGLNHLQAQRPTIALRYLKAAEALSPSDEQAAMGLARAYQSLRDDNNAAKWFSYATGLKADDPDAWYGLAIAYLGLQDSAVIRLGKLGPGQAQARALVADAFVMQGRTKDAIAIYNKFLHAPDRPPCMLAALGFAYAKEGSDAAFETLQNAAKNEPGCLTARVGLAYLAIKREKLSEAWSQLKRAWDVDHNFVRANLPMLWKGLGIEELDRADASLKSDASLPSGLSEVLVHSIESGELGVPAKASRTSPSEAPRWSPEELWAAGRYTECAAKLQKARSAPSPSKALLLAQCSYYASDYRTSLSASEATLKISARSLPALYWKAKSSQELAADALNRMSAIAPGSPNVHLMLAELHRVREEFNAAKAEYAQVIELQPDDPAAHLGLAQVYYRESQDDKAQQELQLALKSNPASPQASFVMGQILVRQHRFSDALPYLKTALNGSPLILPEAHSLLARCYSSQDEYAEALEELKPALPADKNGVYHYQLYQIYNKLGNSLAAAAALQESEKLRREGAAVPGDQH